MSADRAYIGDSIMFGLGSAAKGNPDAREGAGSEEVLRGTIAVFGKKMPSPSFPAGTLMNGAKISAPGHSQVLFSVGSNDPTNPQLIENLNKIRDCAQAAARVCWIVPKTARAAEAVRLIAGQRGDLLVEFVAGPDGIHPRSYSELLRTVNAVLATGPMTPKEAPVVTSKINFIGTGLKLADVDLPRIGHTLGVGEDEIHAFLDVETNGGGFDTAGRPKMLFEPHIFYRHLTGSKLQAAVNAGLAYKAWKPGAYPKDSYPRLQAAMLIDETAALKSASWGIGQVLGENYVAAGYATPQAMVIAMVTGGEPEQLSASTRFIIANHLDDELRAHNWPGFARGYNGSGYAANGYHTKLATAFARWSKIRDTPWTLGTSEPIRAVIPAAKTMAIALAKAPDDLVMIGPTAGKPAPETPADVKIVVKPILPTEPARTGSPIPLFPPPVPQPGFWARVGRLFAGA